MHQVMFPVHYRPRPYQAALHRMWDTKRYGVAVLSRQAGKDVAMSMQSVKRHPSTRWVSAWRMARISAWANG